MADGNVIADADSSAGESGLGVAELQPVAAAEVELRVEVGRLSVTLAELQRLAVGEVVEFPVPVEAPATLVAGGRPVATGELVDVGGRVGVRIVALAGEQGVNG